MSKLSLTLKDIATTILAVLTYGLYYAQSHAIKLGFLTNIRLSILILGIIGIGMCALSGWNPSSNTNMVIVIASILGVASLIFIIYGLITGTKLAFDLLAGTILLLWVVATLRHVLVR